MPIAGALIKMPPVKGLTMRRTSILTVVGSTMLATPALAHVGDHGEHGAAHFLADHGLAAGLAAIVVLAVAVYAVRKMKG